VKALLAKFAPYKAIGLHVGEREVTLCEVASTLFGPVQTSCRAESYEAEQLADALRRILEPSLARRKRRPLPVGVGMPAQRVFFSTRPIRATQGDPSPQALIHEVLQSPNHSIDDMVVEVIKAQPNNRKLASIVSCRRKYLGTLLEALGATGVRPFRAEPAPCALLRAAVQQQASPRKCKIVLRVLLGRDQGLVVVTAGSLVVLWRYFNLTADEEFRAVCSTVRSVQAQIVPCGIDAPVDAVIIHGRTDLRGKFEAENFQSEIGTRLLWCPGPELDDRGVAYGLALGCLGQEANESFDLSRSVKSRPTLAAIFPWMEVAVQVGLLAVAAVFLVIRSHATQAAYAEARAEASQRSELAGAEPAELEKEKRDLEQKVDSVRKFLATRIIWTAYTRDVAARLPASASLNSLYGLCELEYFGKQKEGVLKPKKSFVVRASAPIAKDGSTPKEIDRFLTALRGNPLLKRDFPEVELAEIKWFQPNVTAEPSALFMVVCLPGTKDSPAKAGEKAPEKTAHK
jgi:Tfp pilus assembly protein PilN